MKEENIQLLIRIKKILLIQKKIIYIFQRYKMLLTHLIVIILSKIQ